MLNFMPSRRGNKTLTLIMWLPFSSVFFLGDLGKSLFGLIAGNLGAVKDI
jgi:hypothetical protein